MTPVGDELDVAASAMNDSLELSVVVPVRNGERSLPALLVSLQRQTLDRDRYEVIVVDNASTDRTSSIAQAHGVRVVHEPIPNRARARNRGVSVARGRLYAFTDADCVADSRWLEELVEAQDLAALVAGKVVLRTRGEPNAVERYEALWRFGQEWWVREGWAATANLLVHAEAFAAIGGFDGSWRHIGEDVDFCFRARRHGYELAYCAAAVVEHEGERQLRPMLRRSFLHGYSVNQAHYRLGVGEQAWRRPAVALFGDRALRAFGHAPSSFDEQEWHRMARLARISYAARIAGSVWAEVRRVR